VPAVATLAHRIGVCEVSANFACATFSEVYLPSGAAMAAKAYRGSRAREWGARRAA
jgi:hypothetical protein